MLREKADVRRALGGGVIAGIVGGIVIAVVMLVINLARGQDVWMGMKGAGAPFLGDRAMQPGFDALAVIVGVLSHFAVSVVWGALFGLSFYGLGRRATIAAGVLWGFVVWLGMYYVVLPIIGLSEMARAAPVAEAIVGHVIFGVAVALGFLPFQRRIARPFRPRLERPVTP